MRLLGGPNFGLRLNYYPPLDDADEASEASRLLSHEEVDLFTLLPAPRSDGLEVLNQGCFSVSFALSCRNRRVSRCAGVHALES